LNVKPGGTLKKPLGFEWLIFKAIENETGESNGKLPLRTCPGCSVPELYQSTDWALVCPKPAQVLNTYNKNNKKTKISTFWHSIRQITSHLVHFQIG